MKNQKGTKLLDFTAFQGSVKFPKWKFIICIFFFFLASVEIVRSNQVQPTTILSIWDKAQLKKLFNN